MTADELMRLNARVEQRKQASKQQRRMERHARIKELKNEILDLRICLSIAILMSLYLFIIYAREVLG